MQEYTARRPDAKTIIDTIVEAMREGTEPFDVEFSLVPSEYSVRLHPDAFKELEEIFPLIRERAEIRLNKELERLNTSGTPHLLQRLADWLKRIARLSWLQKAADASAKRLPPAQYKQAGYTWNIQFDTTFDAGDNLGYIAVEAELRAPRRTGSNLAGPKTLKLTVRDVNGSFKTHLLGPDEHATLASVPSIAEPDATVRTVLPNTPKQAEATDEPAAPGRPLARLSFKDDQGPRTYTMTQTEIVVGRGDDDNDEVHVPLKTLPDVSREHLRLRYNPDQNTFLIKDISSFGTTIDGRPVTPSLDKATRRDRDHWEAIPAETTIGLAGVLFIDFKSLV
ncbi:MAG: FHA domain-containing protein [Rhodothermales bacterium]